MKASVISINDAEELEIEGDVDLSIENEKIIIRPLRSKPREGWDRAFV